MSIITLTKHSQHIDEAARPDEGAGVPEKIKITPDMLKAGAAYLAQSGFLDTASEGPISGLLKGALRATLRDRVLFLATPHGDAD